MKIRKLIEDKGIVIRYQPLSDGIRGSVFTKNGKWHIIVNTLDPPERKNFTIAHEYFEIQLSGNKEMTADEKHHEANRLASEFLLPEESFGSLVQNLDLHELKKEFPDASYEVIARRIPFFKQCVVTIFDNGQCSARFGTPGINFSSIVTGAEMNAAAECFETMQTVTTYNAPLNITAFRIDEKNGIRRVILIAEIDEVY